MTPEAEKISPELAKVRESFPTAVELKAGEDTIIAVPPSRMVWRRFKMTMQDERKRPDAFEVLLRDCVKHPEPAEIEAMLNRKPGLAETFGDSLCELAGAGLEVEKNG